LEKHVFGMGIWDAINRVSANLTRHLVQDEAGLS